MRDNIKVLEISPVELRKIQIIMLDILIEFDRICKKNGITYSIGGGTMLGAIRHKGFIPWDGDADVFMLRSEYNKLRKVSETDLDTCRFFFQDYKSDLHYRWGYARILRKDTVFIRAGYEHMKAKNGIFIDVFVFDNVPDNYISKRFHLFSCYCIRKMLWSEAGKKVHPSRLLRLNYWLISLIPRNFIFIILEIIAKRSNLIETELVRHMTSMHINEQKYGIPRKLFEELVEYEFEGHTFLGFKDYDIYLKSAYGDYMSLPPLSHRKSHAPCSNYKLL